MLFNAESEYSLHLARGVQAGYPHDRACSCITREEIKYTLWRMKSGKAIGTNLIPMEI